MKKCVSIFVSTIGTGGAEKQAALLAKALSYDYKVLFIALYGNYEQSKWVVSILKESGADIYLLTDSWLKKIYQFGKILKDNNVYCVFNYLTQCDFFGGIIAKLCGVNLIYNGIRNSEMEIYKVVLEFFAHNFVVSGTIFNSYAGKNAFIQRGFIKNKCITIPNCLFDITDPFIRNEVEIKEIITVGRFVPQKDYKTAIRAISELKKQRKDFVFNIVGYGILENEIRELVKLYNVSDVVRFYISSNEIIKLLVKSDIYLSTSLFEGTSNSIMEAMNCCLPIVATNVGDNQCLVSENNSGFLHSIGDYKGIALSLEKLLSDIDLRNRMGTYANWILRENYSFDTFKTRYISIIEKL